VILLDRIKPFKCLVVLPKMKTIKCLVSFTFLLTFQNVIAQEYEWQVPDKFKLLNDKIWYANYQYLQNQKNSLMLGITHYRSYSNSTGFPELTRHPFHFCVTGDAAVGLMFDTDATRLMSTVNFEYCQPLKKTIYHPIIGLRTIQTWEKNKVSHAIYPELGLTTFNTITIKYGWAVYQTDIMTRFSKHLLSLTFRPGIFLESLSGKWS
jgi:hypothetical protein